MSTIISGFANAAVCPLTDPEPCEQKSITRPAACATSRLQLIVSKEARKEGIPRSLSTMWIRHVTYQVVVVVPAESSPDAALLKMPVICVLPLRQ